jgi:ligand-binding sensor domain-containing protein
MKVLIIVLLFASTAIAQIQTITGGSEDSLWIGRADKLLRVGLKPQVVTWYKGSGEIRTILADQNGDELWVGTEEGLVHCEITAQTCEVDSRIPRGAILAIAQTTRQTLSVASRQKLYQINNKTVTSAALPSNRIDAIAVDGEGVFWIGTGSSVQTFRNGAFQEVLKSSAQAITIEGGKDVVWIGAGHELIRYEKGETKSFSLPAPPANVRMRPPITSILAAGTGEVYVGTTGGLLQPSGDKFQKILEAEVLTLFEDRKGTVWIGTSEGLKKMIGGKIADVPLPD